MRYNRLGLVLHPTRDVAAIVTMILDWAHGHQVEILVDRQQRHRVPDGVLPADPAMLVNECDSLISIGGDGTMLGALRMTVDRPKPVMGVHLGQLGFLVEVDPPELPRALDRLATHDFTIEPRSCLRCAVCEERVVAFNDIALARQPGEGFVNATLAVDGQEYGYYRCDSLVISTPAGSTAYSYAAGGPLISPATEAVVMTPSAPMAGISRSVVLSPAERIRVHLREDSGRVAVEVDGHVVRHVEGGGELEVGFQRGAGQVVRFDPRRYRERSQLKLSLLDLPLLPEQLRELLPETLRRQAAPHRQDIPPD
ncbi:NAD(+)/NADH kinase [Plantactinospora sp. KBS50]|uniref:NAD(+)/NADH kinase n=1 Tax=Plantactinospora sp. KBS50 TaxID=2024580 RepID=UPI000BAA965E|nr:NAD(+)/NADH kinase [Plantactinospora sp. KBS50]ASW54496.1 NAD(+) kinase [Plantactinospora sp. KBS50]